MLGRGVLRRVRNATAVLKRGGQISYAQCGEDLIINFIFQGLKISKPTYLDIGAHHPTWLSNTFFFYLQGCRGVLVEADPFLCEEIRRIRKKDTVLNVGAGWKGAAASAKLYVMTARYLNTFSEEEALRYVSYGSSKIEQELSIPIIPVSQIVQENFTSSPNLISIDVEGMDLEILKFYDFENHAPEVICVETITYTEDASEEKVPEIKSYMEGKGYFLYADTYINSIFVRQDVWSKRLGDVL